MDLFVPGRICLFGEHSDWAGGYRRVNPRIEQGHTLICGTDQGIYARVARHPDALVLTAQTPEGHRRGPARIPLKPERLLEIAQKGGFWSYIAGTAYQALRRYPVGGLEIDNARTDLPVRKGLSSSAAICVLTARAFNRLYGLGLSVEDEMELAYQGETTTPSRCGRMDQGCAFGKRVTRMTFDGDQLFTEAAPVGRPIYMIIVDLRASKNTVKILARLNACYPEARDKRCRAIQKLLGPINADMVKRAMAALQAGDAPRIGALMSEAQTLFDRYAAPICPEELTAPVLHRVLSDPGLQPHIWGGKGVGSQGDGAAQLVARSPADQDAAIQRIESAWGMPCLKLILK